MTNLTDLIHYGVVEVRDTDPLRLGRCKVRVIGLHTENTEELPTEDLPWAYPMGSLTSASMSGIGHAPVGPVEGTIVVVLFRDAYKQHPLIIGTLGGIPEEFPEYETMIVNSRASASSVTNDRQVNVLQDSSGQPVNDGSGQPVQTTPSETPKQEEKPAIKKPGGMKVSTKGRSWMQDNEGLASLSPGKTKIGNSRSKIDDNATIHAYQDSGGVWTIGWGNTQYADGSRVKAGDTMTKAQADKLFDVKHQEFADAVNRDLKVPVTQSMFDSLVDMSYNMGHAGLTKSKMWSALNNGRYEEAAALIPSTRATVKGQPNKGLTNRRNNQKNKFLEDGIPSKDMSEVKPDPTKEKEEAKPGTSTDKTNNPAVRKDQQIKKENQEGDDSFSQTIIDEREDKESEGFRDPNEMYPLKQFLNEPDTHRLARHEKIDETIVVKKEAARVTGIKMAFDKTWDQPMIPYNALYPFNQVFVSESGHVQEFDNTKGNERIHTYHTSGTFEEVDVNGTRVNRIVGDGYEIFERNGYVLVKGTCALTVQGSVRIRVENDANIQVLGNCKTEVTGNMETSVAGDYKLKAKNVQIEAYSGDIDVKATGVYAEDASSIYMNSGVAVATNLKTPTEKAKGEPEFPTLEVPDRTNEYQGNYESDEEGDNTEFMQAMVENGVVKPEQMKGQEASGNEEREKPEPKPAPEKKQDDQKKKQKYEIGDGPFSANTRLNDNWTLGDVAKGRSGIPNGTHYGKSSKEIVTNLQSVADNVLDPIKKKYPNIVITNSWRSEAVNNSIPGASKNSDHLRGQAVDLQFSGFDRKQTYEAVKEIQKTLPDYDQILLEYAGDKTWVHISYKDEASGGNRREIKTIDVYNKKNNVNGEFVLYDRK